MLPAVQLHLDTGSRAENVKDGDDQKLPVESDAGGVDESPDGEIEALIDQKFQWRAMRDE